VDWINGKSSIKNTSLTHWFQRIIQLKEIFSHIKVRHLYREHNAIADSLSKEGITLDEGSLLYREDKVPEWVTVKIY